MAKNVLLVALLLFVFVLAAAVVRLENYHYASQIGTCGEYHPGNPLENSKRHECLHQQQTRTSALWHLFYAMRGE